MTPLPRDEAIARLERLAAEERKLRAEHERAELELKAATLANSYHLLPEGHPAYLSLAEIAEAIGRHLSRPAWWNKQIVTDRGGIRARIREVLGQNPIPDYGPLYPLRRITHNGH